MCLFVSSSSLSLRILHVQVYGLNALHVAAKLGHTKFVEALLEKKASQKARARGGTTQGSFATLHTFISDGAGYVCAYDHICAHVSRHIA